MYLSLQFDRVEWLGQVRPEGRDREECRIQCLMIECYLKMNDCINDIVIPEW